MTILIVHKLLKYSHELGNCMQQISYSDLWIYGPKLSNCQALAKFHEW